MIDRNHNAAACQYDTLRRDQAQLVDEDAVPEKLDDPAEEEERPDSATPNHTTKKLHGGPPFCTMTGVDHK